jgi:hypothetical protein
VDNFVDNSASGRPSSVRSGSAAPIAQKDGMTFLFEINDIDHNVGASAPTSVRNANAGAAVELSPRAARCSADG